MREDNEIKNKNDNKQKTLQERCQECADYIRFIYERICFNPEQVQVTFKLGDFVHFYIEGSERDDGVFIGRNGVTIQSLRVFIHAYSRANLEGMPCIVEVKDHRNSKYNPISPNSAIYKRNSKR